MTGKQRAKLRAIAGSIEPCFQIGKENITANQIEGLGQALEKREIIKINVLKSCNLKAQELLLSLSQKLEAEPVTAIGNKVILYKKSNRKDIKHLEI